MGLFNQKNYIFTSESVSKGHPDKLCDQISDLIVDMYLKEDPYAHTAIETLATTNRVIVAGEVNGPSSLKNEIEGQIRQLVKEIGYEQRGFHHEHFEFQNYLHQQSSDIAQGVNASEVKEEGAGDQGIMFGFACTETEAFMPAPLYWAHRLLENLEDYRLKNPQNFLGPDAKSQISLLYENGKPIKAYKIVLSTQHDESASLEEVRNVVIPIIEQTLPKDWMCSHEDIFINPTGRFVIGGPDGDTGLTGRKIIVDTYGGAAPHGGGAFSGKDPTKVDRSAAYMARYLAKNIVASGMAERCVIQLSYAIGLSKPLSLFLNFEGTGIIPEHVVCQKILKDIDLSPAGIRKQLKLNAPIYLPTASFGHFGRTPINGLFEWEKLNLVDYFKNMV